MIDIILVVVILVVTWCVASEGAWGAALMCLCVIFSGLLAMNFFEPLANLLQSTIWSSGTWSHRCDVISLVGLFAAFIFLLRILTERISPKRIQMHEGLQQVCRWALALLTGYVTMAFLLTALHTASLPREFIGFRPERKNFFDMVAPDRQWLGFTQYVSENVFQQGGVSRIFDGTVAKIPGQDNDIWPSFPIVSSGKT